MPSWCSDPCKPPDAAAAAPKQQGTGRGPRTSDPCRFRISRLFSLAGRSSVVLFHTAVARDELTLSCFFHEAVQTFPEFPGPIPCRFDVRDPYASVGLGKRPVILPYGRVLPERLNDIRREDERRADNGKDAFPDLGVDKTPGVQPDQPLDIGPGIRTPLFLGVKRWALCVSSICFTVLSIHPKQRASSTASL